jgi:osmotically-inducible protein OsmY
MQTDAELRQHVLDELDWDPRFDARDIAVTAKDGVVTLSGKVTTFAEKSAAEEATQAVRGVRAIANEIEIEPQQAAQRDDTHIASAALVALKAHVAIPAADIKVIVRNGWITLEGEVPLRFQADMAEKTVQNLWGVKGVINNITLKTFPQTKAAAVDVKAKIQDAFRRHAQLDADAIQVSVDDGTLILSGSVHSLRERNDAEAAAWAAPGVRRIDNRIRVQL